MKETEYKKYISILTIEILNIKISLKVGNPFWYIKELKNKEE